MVVATMTSGGAALRGRNLEAPIDSAPLLAFADCRERDDYAISEDRDLMSRLHRGDAE
jgi:hypothetical protein